MFTILVMVIVSWVRTCQIVHFKNVRFIVGQLYLNKAVLIYFIFF